jgi:hypothetical protein
MERQSCSFFYYGWLVTVEDQKTVPRYLKEEKKSFCPVFYKLIGQFSFFLINRLRQNIFASISKKRGKK